MKREFLFGLLLTLQILVFSNTCAAHNSIYFQPDDTNEVNRQLKLYLININADTANARKNLEEALLISRKLGYFDGISRSATFLAKYFHDQFNLSMAESYYSESFGAAQKCGNKNFEARTANNLGKIAQEKSYYSSALSYYLYANEIFISMNDLSGISATTNNIAAIYYQLDELEKALELSYKSLNLKLELNDTLSLIYPYQNLGSIYSGLREYDSARYYYQKCIDLCVLQNDIISAGKVYNSLGYITLLEEDYSQALELFNRALSYSRIKNDVLNVSSVLKNLGILEFDKGNLSTSTHFFDSSLVLSRQYGFKEEMKNVYQYLAYLNAQEDRYKDAFHYLSAYDSLQTSLLTEKGEVSGVEALFIKQKQDFEKERLRGRFILLLSALLILLISSILGFYIYQLSQKSINARKIAELEKERFKSVIEAQEIERKRIAGDLHDSVGQMLSLSKLQLSEIIDSSKMLKPEHEEMLKRSTHLIDEVCQEVRNISHNLMPGPLIRLGLVAAIKDMVRKMNASNKINALFTNNIADGRFDEKIEISAYRIIQEILGNIMKHAKASQVGIALSLQSDKRLELSIEDNGIGFDTSEIPRSSGIGWKNIYSRLEIINGTMKVKSIKNTGTNINIKILL